MATIRVHSPEVAELLSPSIVIGYKRLCVDTGYWETYNRPNVTLIDVISEPIEAITPAGIRAKDQEYAVDAIDSIAITAPLCWFDPGVRRPADSADRADVEPAGPR